jgi:cellulose synthase/poly-beta-1,6-N-acetylglucosamine synthase-like glycosyltransferase
LAVIALIALTILVTGWVGYPIVTGLLAKWRPDPGSGPDAPRPTVSVILATRDEPDVVARRVANILDTEYPREQLDVVVTVDAGAPGAIEAYRAILGTDTSVVSGDLPGGKALALNAGVRAATGELIVFTDARHVFVPDTIPRLVQYLGDGRFGAVSGTLSLAPEHYARTVLGLFWKYELLLRRSEAAIHSLVGVTGAVYCVRRSLWTSLSAGLICDDLFVPLNLAMNGHRVGHCEEARAFDPRHFSRTDEFRRRVRTLTGILQLCAWHPWILIPWRNPIWIQFVCHKLLRVVTPYLIILVVIGLAPWLTRIPGPWMVTAGAAVLMTALLISILRPAVAQKVGSQVLWAIRLNAAPVQASLNAVRGRWDVW